MVNTYHQIYIQTFFCLKKYIFSNFRLGEDKDLYPYFPNFTSKCSN